MYRFQDYWPDLRVHRDGRWLDVACGAGHNVARFFLDCGVKDYTGVDRRPESLEALRGMGCAVHDLDLENQSIDPLGKFDVIVSSETLEHLSKGAADRLLCGSIYALRTGGALLLSFPVFANMEVKETLHQPNYLEIRYRAQPYFKHFRWGISPNGKSMILLFAYRL